MFYFLKKYKFILIIIPLITIFSLSFINYQNSEQRIRSKYQQRRELVEQSIKKTFRHVNKIYGIAEKQLNQKMKEKSNKLLKIYKENPDVGSWNLEEIQKDFKGFHIYIVNSDLEVIRSTFEPDIGLDFNRFPSFSKLLRKRLESDEFAVDRMDQSIKTKEISKYSYQPTPDNKYLLELGAKMNVLYPELTELNVYEEAKNLIKNYRSVEEISFYKYSPETDIAGKLSTKGEGVYVDIPELEEKNVKKVFRTTEILTAEVEGKENYMRTYLPVFTAGEAENWWDSFAVGISYNDNYMLKEINETRNIFLINAFIMLFIFILFTVLMVYLLNRFQYMAYHDNLTGLANRKLFSNQLTKKLEEERKKAVVFVELNNFREINEKFGHKTGDKIITASASRLKNMVNSLDENGEICRLGGVKFAITLAGVDLEELKDTVDQIIKSFNKPVEIDQNNFFISVTLGISLYPKDGKDLDTLFKKADHALYQAKDEKKDYIIHKK